jgi:hypothetical protein
VIGADLRDPAAILNHPRTLELIDFRQPLAVLLVAILHFIGADNDPYGIVGSICEALPAGSYVVISHALVGMLRGDSVGKVEQQYKKNVATGATLRDREEILRSSPDWSSSSRALSTCRTGTPMIPDRGMLARSGFSVPSGASPAWMQPQGRSSSRSMPRMTG